MPQPTSRDYDILSLSSGKRDDFTIGHQLYYLPESPNAVGPTTESRVK